MAIAGFNYFLKDDPSDAEGEQVNQLPQGDDYTYQGLDPDTDYSARIYGKAVDYGGNQSGASNNPTGAVTGHYVPDGDPMSDADAAAIDAIMTQCLAANGPYTTSACGISIIGPRGHYARGYSPGASAPARTKLETCHYRTASQTKTFTAVLILRAVEAGLLELDDTIEQYYPGVPNGTIITVRHCLSMSSGVFDYQLQPSLGQNFTITPTSAMTVEQIMRYIKGGAPMFPPGEGWHYTNSNYFVLGKILEAIDPDHRPYDQMVQEDLLDVVGMANSYVQMSTGVPISPYSQALYQAPILTAIYAFLGLPPVMKDCSNQNPAYVWAAGAIISTLPDLMLWFKALRDGAVLGPTMKHAWFTEFLEQPLVGHARYGLTYQGPESFGYGLGAVRVGSWVGHDGSWLGHDSCTMIEPSSGAIISVYENYQTGAPHVLAAISTMWYEVAEYLYPGSAFYQNFLADLTFTLPPVHSTLQVGTPVVKSYAQFPGIHSTLRVGTPTVDGGFIEFTESDVEHTDEPWPPGLHGIRVKFMLGAGAAGSNTTDGSGWAGPTRGGGGGARIDEIDIPRALLGPTRTVVRGVGAARGSKGDGGDTIFRSGAIELIAGGGKAGVGGVATATVPAGLDTTGKLHNGKNSNTSDSTEDVGAGGGLGAGSLGGAQAGKNGGASLTQAGGLHGAPGQDGPDAERGHGGPGGGGGNSYSKAGGDGGDFGGGGGGAGQAYFSNGVQGGAGGIGCIDIEHY